MSNDLKVSIKPRFSCLLPLQEKIEFGHSGLGGVGKVKFFVILKSVNLQYNTLGCLDDGTNELLTKRLMFQVFFFIISCKILCKNPFNLFSYIFIILQKLK